MGNLYYFDYAAATPIDPNVKAAMQPFFDGLFYNPSADYEPAREVKKHLEKARADAASVLAVRPAEIVFTAGGSEANNLAISGIMRKHPDANVVFTAIEHDSVRVPAAQYNHSECAVQANGVVSVDELISKVTDKTVLVSAMYANNEIGTIQPIRKISQALETFRVERKKQGNNLPLYLHTDAAQAGNYLSLNAHRLGVDLMSVNGGKIYGPKQSGLLYIRGGVELEPLILGGGQERHLRSGTENVAACVGLAAALKITEATQDSEVRRLQELQRNAFRLFEEKIPGLVVNGSVKHRLPNNIHVTIPGTDNERLLILLDQAGIYAAAGSACSASSMEPSHVLSAIGLDGATIRSALRFTMGRNTTQESIDHLVATLVTLLAKN